MPALPPGLPGPLRDQLAALLPTRQELATGHPPGCHRRRVPDRTAFEHVVPALVHGSDHERISTPKGPDRTIRRRVKERAEHGISKTDHAPALEAYDGSLPPTAPRPGRERYATRQGCTAWSLSQPGRGGRTGPSTVTAAVLGPAEGERVRARGRRPVPDGKPVLVPTPYPAAGPAAATPIAQPDPGSGNTGTRVEERRPRAGALPTGDPFPHADRKRD